MLRPALNPKLALLSLAFCLALPCAAQKVVVPTSVVAGQGATLTTTGSGKATFYLSGPGVASKTEVNLGEEIRVSAGDLKAAGAYIAILCTDTCHSPTFFVTAARPANLTFLVHPSRVPVGEPDAVSGVAFPFDKFNNMVLDPVPVKFELRSGNSPPVSHTVRTQNGVAWFRTASGKTAGKLQLTASLDSVESARVLQQVASDPCNLRIKGQRTPKGITLETEPVRDCSGNPVPDGTVVTFNLSGPNGKTTVDAPIKQGVARALVEAQGPQTVSVASGVVMGNELRIGGQP
jgi:hypothetical protein